MASTTKLEDLNVTHEELERITECLKQDEFKKLFFEYAEEISNPENRARYETEIRQLENERGMDVKFVNPEPGFVIKTTIDGELKAFINVCRNDNVGKPSSAKKTGKDGRPGLSWTVPHSFTPPREDLDRSKNKCRVYDFVVHTETYRLAETNSRFKTMICDLALDGIQKQFDVELDSKNVRFPKLRYKGPRTPAVIRTRLPNGSQSASESDPAGIMSKFPYPYDNQTSAEKAKQREDEYVKKHSTQKNISEQKNATKENEKEFVESEFTLPKYTVTHRSEIDYLDYASDRDIRRNSTHPKSLVVEVFLPLLNSAAPIQLNVFERQLKLRSEKPAKYMLEVCLPYAVDENLGTAKFDKVHRKLVVTLPVVAEQLSLVNDVSRGAGDENVEGENGRLNDPDDDDDELVLKLPNDSGDTDRPLIEEICSTCLQNSAADTPTDTEVYVTSSETSDLNDETKLSKETMFSIVYVLPEFECSQTLQTIRYEFHVFKVSCDQTSLDVVSASAFQLKMLSVGDGGFPVHYSCYVSFDNNCHIVPDDLKLEVLMDKVVLSAAKDSQSFGWWDKYMVGTDPHSLEVSQCTYYHDYYYFFLCPPAQSL